MSENPGIYKISGSRSSAASSDQGQSRYRQDTGYSSSSKDSANSNRRVCLIYIFKLDYICFHNIHKQICIYCREDLLMGEGADLDVVTGVVDLEVQPKGR